MHDPMHVVMSIRRPWAKGRERRGHGTRKTREFAFWSLRDAEGIDHEGHEYRLPLRRRIYASWAFFRLGGREWYLPSLLTVWHRDPEKDGTDSSCRNAARAKRQAAIKSRRFIQAAWWDWWWQHYDKFHVHHWSLQFDAAQRLHRWLLTRCEVCGERFPYGYSPVNVHGWSAKSWQGWRKGERGLAHGGPNRGRQCSEIASIRATKESLPSWLRQWGKDNWCMTHQREREPYMGCYAWWREAILGEDRTTAAERAATHVQRSMHPCPDCAGGITSSGEPCNRCEGTGHERVENPIPAEVI